MKFLKEMAILLNSVSQQLAITIDSPVFEAPSAHHLCEQWRNHPESDYQSVRIDLDKVESIDSIAICALLQARRELAAGIPFSLENARPEVLRVLDLLGIDLEFPEEAPLR